MAALSVLHPYVLLDCPGVPIPLMDDAIRRGAREFCKETHALVEYISVPTVATQADYAPTLSADTEFIAVEQISLSNTEILIPSTRDYVDRQPAGDDDPVRFAVLATYPLSIRVHPTPDSVRTMTVQLVVIPTQDATTIDDKLVDWFKEGVVAYANYWLQRQPNKPWSNPDYASISYRQFDAKVADARVRHAQEHANIVRHVLMVPFA